jgi:hypothetical protein
MIRIFGKSLYQRVIGIRRDRINRLCNSSSRAIRPWEVNLFDQLRREPNPKKF